MWLTGVKQINPWNRMSNDNQTQLHRENEECNGDRREERAKNG